MCKFSCTYLHKMSAAKQKGSDLLPGRSWNNPIVHCLRPRRCGTRLTLARCSGVRTLLTWWHRASSGHVRGLMSHAPRHAPDILHPVSHPPTIFQPHYGHIHWTVNRGDTGSVSWNHPELKTMDVKIHDTWCWIELSMAVDHCTVEIIGCLSSNKI